MSSWRDSVIGLLLGTLILGLVILLAIYHSQL